MCIFSFAALRRSPSLISTGSSKDTVRRDGARPCRIDRSNGETAPTPSPLTRKTASSFVPTSESSGGDTRSVRSSRGSREKTPSSPNQLPNIVAADFTSAGRRAREAPSQYRGRGFHIRGRRAREAPSQYRGRGFHIRGEACILGEIWAGRLRRPLRRAGERRGHDMIERSIRPPSPRGRAARPPYDRTLDSAPSPRGRAARPQYNRTLASPPSPRGQAARPRYDRTLDSAPSPRGQAARPRYNRTLDSPPSPRGRAARPRWTRYFWKNRGPLEPELRADVEHDVHGMSAQVVLVDAGVVVDLVPIEVVDQVHRP